MKVCYGDQIRVPSSFEGDNKEKPFFLTFLVIMPVN